MSLRAWFRRSTTRLLVTALVGAYAAAAGAQGTVGTTLAGGPLRWDCWISSDPQHTIVSYLIRCIADRGVPPEEPPIDTTEALLLDELHERIHRDEGPEIDRDLALGRFNLVASYIQQIRIHQYPYEESWQQGQPRELVKAVLCKSEPECPVLLNH